MSTPKPHRLQFKRVKGFDYKQISLDYNGLPGVYCARPGAWGNPYIIGDVDPDYRLRPIMTNERAVELFRRHLQEHPELIEYARQELRGKNLFCFCGPDEPCHADVWLEVANS